MKSFTKAKEPLDMISPERISVSLRFKRDGSDMVTGSTDGDKSGGRPDPPQGSSVGGHPTSTHTSPVVAALVAVVIISAAAILFWWIASRIRRSRRGVPRVVLIGDRDTKPTLSDVALSFPHDSKDPHTTGWGRLSPVSVDYASELDQKRWHSLSELSQDDASLSTSFSKTKPSSFTMFSRASSPATTITPDPEPIEFRVAMVIAMPSQGASQASGELCLGVAYSPLY